MTLALRAPARTVAIAIAAATTAALLLGACSDDTPTPIPAEHGALLASHADDGCPDLTGRYDVRDPRAARTLLGLVHEGTRAQDGPHVPPDAAYPGILWIDEDPASAWRFVLRPAGQALHDAEFRVPDERLTCRRGWLEHHGDDRSVDWRLGRLASRSLVLQVTREVGDQINLWCGDGCKGIPTGRHRADEFVVALEVARTPVGGVVPPVASALARSAATPPKPVAPVPSFDVAPVLARVPADVEVERLEARGAMAELACASDHRESLEALRLAIARLGYGVEGSVNGGAGARWRLVARITGR